MLREKSRKVDLFNATTIFGLIWIRNGWALPTLQPAVGRSESPRPRADT